MVHARSFLSLHQDLLGRLAPHDKHILMQRWLMVVPMGQLPWLSVSLNPISA